MLCQVYGKYFTGIELRKVLWASLIAQLIKKESTCNAGDTSLIPELGRSAGEGNRLPTPIFLGFPCGSAGKEFTRNVRDWVRSLGWEDPLQ